MCSPHFIASNFLAIYIFMKKKELCILLGICFSLQEKIVTCYYSSYTNEKFLILSVIDAFAPPPPPISPLLLGFETRG